VGVSCFSLDIYWFGDHHNRGLIKLERGGKVTPQSAYYRGAARMGVEMLKPFWGACGMEKNLSWEKEKS